MALEDVLTGDVVRELLLEEGPLRFEIIKTEKPEEGHKSVRVSSIIRDTETGKHYRIGGSRRGSDWSEWEWSGEPGGKEVELREVTVKQWVEVK